MFTVHLKTFKIFTSLRQLFSDLLHKDLGMIRTTLDKNWQGLEANQVHMRGIMNNNNNKEVSIKMIKGRNNLQWWPEVIQGQIAEILVDGIN
jgi:hypothetical protein